MTRKKPTKLEVKIITIAKKLKTFTVNDIEVLTECSKLEVMKTLEYLVSKNKLKENDEYYVYIPSKMKNHCKNKISCNENSLIHSLPFMPKKPKEIFIKRINDLDGFVDYFFAPPKVKEKIKKIFNILKETQGLKGGTLRESLKKHEMSVKSYNKYKEEVCKNGLINLVGKYTSEPGEIYQFYKEYYLSPKGLTSEEARELAIQRFERLIKIYLNRGKITSSSAMLKRLKQEYKDEQIEKFRNYNFSKFDTEKMFEENVEKSSK